MHHIFVYGTLKRNFPNHHFIGKIAKYEGRYKTVEAFPLVVGGPWYSPYLIDEPGVSVSVIGELYSVDAAGLTFVDDLEGVGAPGAYRRVAIEISPCDDVETVETVWTYVKDRKDIEGIHDELGSSYERDQRYILPKNRKSRF